MDGLSLKDRNGVEIVEGDVVACTVTINQSRHDPFALYVVRRGKVPGEDVDGRCIWLDGVYGYGRLSDWNPMDLLVLKPGVDLREVFNYFCERGRQHAKGRSDEAPRQLPTDQSMFVELVTALLEADHMNTIKLRHDLDLTQFLRGNTIHEISRVLREAF